MDASDDEVEKTRKRIMLLHGVLLGLLDVVLWLQLVGQDLFRPTLRFVAEWGFAVLFVHGTNLLSNVVARLFALPELEVTSSKETQLPNLAIAMILATITNLAVVVTIAHLRVKWSAY